MVAPLLFVAYLALASMVVVPSLFLGAVSLDYYHLPGRFQYRITGPMGYVSTSLFAFG